MCGITGFTGNYGRPVLERMNRTLFHRGPDEAGVKVLPGVGLAMRRLSIIDVASGHQPIPNEDETIWTVFNGEIYNFRELRRDLQKKGYRFRTDHSDTETIVHAYEEYGRDFVKHLNGMFAIAVWDMRRQTLLLYRDRMGEKPLYFWRHRNDLFFASEIKALLTLPFFRKKMNPEALFYYLSLKHAPRGHGFFEGIEQLGPGEGLEFRAGRLKRFVYWEINAQPLRKITEAEAVEEIRFLLKDSVRYRMISDVPLGAYLSGGVDSSAVVGLMSRLRRTPIETFSLAYEDAPAQKESDRASAEWMARKFRTKHREYIMGHDEFVADIEKVAASFDEPFGGTVSTYFLSKLIRKHVKVAVSGDGADELFGSYRIHRLAQPLSALNRLLARGANPFNLSAAQKKQLMPFENEIPYLMKLQSPHPWDWHARLGVFQDADKKALLTAGMLRKMKGLSLRQYYKKAYARAKTDDILNAVLQVECQNLLADHVLAFVDRLSMAHSVEVRPPFLDHRLVEFVFRLPGRMKIHDGVNKAILKKAVSNVLPKQILTRPKEGFILPYHYWMQKYMMRSIRKTLSPKQLAKHGCFQPAAVQQMLDSFSGGTLEAANRIYLIYLFQIWWNRYFD